MNKPENLIFTRYLYIKDEVRIAMLVSILNKSNNAIFWAYELYYSGFKDELINLILKIYYDFFATLNPSYEIYLVKMNKELISDIDGSKDYIVSSLIQDLLFRPFNSDIFMLRNVCEIFEIDVVYYHTREKITNIEELRCNAVKWVENNDLRSIAQCVSTVVIDAIDIYSIFLDIFETEITVIKQKMKKELVSLIDKKNKSFIIIVLLAKIVQLFTKRSKLIKKSISVYIDVNQEDIIPYKTIMGTTYSILERAYMCGIDDFKHLSLFKLTRNKYNNIRDEYYYRWEYYASFSPIWEKRINAYGGYCDNVNKKVIFKEEPDDELMQEFYGLYGLEPDEQTLQTQNKSIQLIEKIHNWKWFDKQYNKNGIFEVYDEELDEFDTDGLKY